MGIFSRSRKASTAKLETDTLKMPVHVGIIMDGNGRWATRRHLPRFAGHKAGVNALRTIVEAASDMKLPMISVYAFSTENWGRPRDEIQGLMQLFWESVKSDLDKLHAKNVKLVHIGKLEGLDKPVRDAIDYAHNLTHANTGLVLNVCFNYGGRSEIVDAMREILQSGTHIDQINEQMISDHLYTRKLPDPDLIIRTAGEMRLSNFLIWQAAYSEYYSTEKLWPDFGREDFILAIQEYSSRKRRFGKLDNE